MIGNLFVTLFADVETAITWTVSAFAALPAAIASLF
jgi:hypothetical protein